LESVRRRNKIIDVNALVCTQNKTKRILEQKREAISKLEAKRLQRDEEMKREAQEARDRILERARKLKFEERDETKTFNRAIQHCEVIDLIIY